MGEEKWGESGQQSLRFSPCGSLPSCSLTQVAVIVDGTGLAGLQLPLHQVDQVFRVVGFCNLFLGGRQDLAWGRHEELGGWRRGWRGRGPLGADGVALQKSGSGKGSLWRVVEKDIYISRKGEEIRDRGRSGKDGDLRREEGREAVCQGTKGQQRKDLPCQK